MPGQMKIWAAGAALILLVAGQGGRESAYAVAVETASPKYSGKKILWIDSYHQGYEWSDGLEQGIRSALRQTGAVLEIYRMDTKRDDSEEFAKRAGLEALAVVEQFKPDVVIASDDNVQKYLVVPFLRDKDLPIVFCGVNWDASGYGYPTRNITGMIEMHLVGEIVTYLRSHARGDRIGLLSGDIETARRAAVFFNKRFFDGRMKTYLVNNFEDFKKEFLRAQEEVDMLLIYNNAGMPDWETTEAERFLAHQTRIPTGGIVPWMAPYVVFDLAVLPEEHGEYAARTALSILDGTRPADIPIVENKEYKLTVNLKMAGAADIVFPLSVLKTARIIGRDVFDFGLDSRNHHPGQFQGKKVLWVDSYHQGYEWSDGIEKGIRDVLYDTGIELRVFRMDTKRNDSEAFGQEAGLKARAVVEEFKPDVVIASDDNAQKYLVVPDLKDKGLPVVFCGVNWDASMYGYPCANVTGMVEVDMVEETLGYFRQYARGNRVGYLSGDVETERKIVGIYNERFFGGQMKSYLVKTFDEFRKAFLRSQQEVDMLFVYNYAGISDWDGSAAEAFLARETKIPTGSPNPFMAPFTVFTLAKLPEEQGSFAAQAALQILAGTKPADIPVALNKHGQLTVNLRMAKSANIVLPVAILRNANVIGQGALEGP